MIYTKMMSNEAWIAQESYEKGFKVGYEKGILEARLEHREEDINKVTKICEKFGFSKERIEETIKIIFPETL